MIVEVDGKPYEVPDDATPEEIDALTKEEAAPAPATVAPKEKTALETIAGAFSTSDITPPPLDRETTLKRLVQAAKEQFVGPTNKDELVRKYSPAAGKYGFSRILEEEGKRVGRAVRGSAKNLAEKFVELPGVREFPRAAAGLGAAGEALAELASDSLTPSAMQQAAGAEGLGAAARLVRPLAEAKVGPGVISAIFGPSKEAAAARLATPAAIQNAKPVEQLAREFPEAITALEQEVTRKSDAALETLSKSRYMNDNAFPKDGLFSIFEAAKRDLGGGLSQATARAKAALSDYMVRLKRLPETISEYHLGQILRDIRNDINWDNPEAGPLNNALKQAQNKIDDILKGTNDAYREAMAPLAEDVRNLEKARSIFSLKRVNTDAGPMFEPTNATVPALKGAEKETRIASQDILARLKELTGRDYLDEITNARFASEFEGGVTQGSRRTTPLTTVGTALGSTVGGLIGHELGGWTGATLGAGAGGTVGGTVGAIAGSVLDVSGRKIAGNLIDWYVRNKPAELGKFAPQLAAAANRGIQELAKEDFLLQHKDPEYRELKKQLEADNGGE